MTTVLPPYSLLFPFNFPKTRHIFQRFAFRFGDESPNEDSRHDAHHAIKSIGEPMAEVVARSEVHVEHGDEGRANDEVKDPLRRHSDGRSRTTDGIGEDFRNQHPTNRAP